MQPQQKPQEYIAPRGIFARLRSAIKDNRIKSGLKRRLHPFLHRLGLEMQRRPWLDKFLSPVIGASPRLKLRMQRIMWGQTDLSPHVETIYRQLKWEISRRR